ncbi:MAG TPA: hypothetical protein VHO03_16795 [Ignavibacteriales bacterium]|nr:hypothetical protein [Ignavibacteriales bacterium]
MGNSSIGDKKKMIVLYTRSEGERYSMLRTKQRGRKLIKFLKRPKSGIFSFLLPNGYYWHRGCREEIPDGHHGKWRKEPYKHILRYLTDPDYKKKIDAMYEYNQ